MIRIRIDTRALEGSLDAVSISPEELGARRPNPKLESLPAVPADAQLWSMLQNASGGCWQGCIYDPERIGALIAQGVELEALRRASPAPVAGS